jgi:hypothetical protein
MRDPQFGQWLAASAADGFCCSSEGKRGGWSFKSVLLGHLCEYITAVNRAGRNRPECAINRQQVRHPEHIANGFGVTHILLSRVAVLHSSDWDHHL